MALWMADCTPLTEETALTRALPHLDTARRAAVTRQQNGQTRAQHAAAGLLLTRCFGQAGRPPLVAHGAHGKPYLPDKSAHFSLSHTGRFVFLLTAAAPVGLDAQPIDGSRPRVARRCFTPSEQAWLSADPEQRFARLWAMKEAYLKYTGFGLVLPMSSFTVPLPPLLSLFLLPPQTPLLPLPESVEFSMRMFLPRMLAVPPLRSPYMKPAALFPVTEQPTASTS